jgi:hypothetical protein
MNTFSNNVLHVEPIYNRAYYGVNHLIIVRPELPWLCFLLGVGLGLWIHFLVSKKRND